ncbi:unnamed protein product [Nesidiocoris tenuis]|uniref:Uncharacterized protein n=1 Tax=Nesidiocoris tenuis TaxID=355587 RepID=A0A6H5HLC8_9HEMI|nr:unnamed protein product [Nesidiocoris tenuis]
MRVCKVRATCAGRRAVTGRHVEASARCGSSTLHAGVARYAYAAFPLQLCPAAGTAAVPGGERSQMVKI